MSDFPSQSVKPIRDGFSRAISYIRLSVTDRCDLRCGYCMPERMHFAPRADLLTLDELYVLGRAFMARGVRRIRVTGGEPLVRRGVMDLIRTLGRHIGHELDEVTLTTNATQLAHHANALADAGVRRVNVSLDTRDRARFHQLTRQDALAQVLNGIEAAKAAGLVVKINMVALKGINQHEIPAMMRWAHDQGFHLCLIETMPLGDVDLSRNKHFVPLTEVKAALQRDFSLSASRHTTGGPARYFDVLETGGKVGFICPLTENFCATCNRMRVTATGQLYPCLGGSEKVDLREALRSEDADVQLAASIDHALRIKPKRHDFRIGVQDLSPAQPRHMSVTGG